MVHCHSLWTELDTASHLSVQRSIMHVLVLIIVCLDSSPGHGGGIGTHDVATKYQLCI